MEKDFSTVPLNSSTSHHLKRRYIKSIIKTSVTISEYIFLYKSS